MSDSRYLYFSTHLFRVGATANLSKLQRHKWTLFDRQHINFYPNSTRPTQDPPVFIRNLVLALGIKISTFHPILGRDFTIFGQFLSESIFFGGQAFELSFGGPAYTLGCHLKGMTLS